MHCKICHRNAQTSYHNVNNHFKELTFKVVIVGESFVGKTSLCLRMLQNKFYSSQDSTIGVSFTTANINKGT